MSATPKKPAHKQGSPGKHGAPVGNKNAIRHGLRAGSLPKDCKHVEIACNRLRRELEDECLRVKGEVNLQDAACIATALRWERHGALCLRWLRLRGGELKPAEFIKFSESIARASAERDRAIRLLELNRDKTQDQWALLDAEPTEDSDHD